MGHGDSYCPRPGTNIQDKGRFISRDLESLFHKHFGFRARYEDRGCNLEIQRPEFLLSSDVLSRLERGPSANQAPEKRQLFR